MSLTLGLNTALSGLLTSQRGLDVISQNVVNVNTVGYTRKTMNAESRVLAGRGAGVQEGSISRIIDHGLLKDIRKQNASLGKLEAESHFYPRIEDMFGEVADDTSVAHRIASLAGSFEQLAVQVNKPSAQWGAVQASMDATQQLNSMSTQLQSLRQEADRLIEDTVTDINQQLTDINELNIKIVRNGAISAGTADLEDKRDIALSKLSKLIDIQYSTRGDGSTVVYANGGQMLVDSDAAQIQYASSSSVEASMSAAAGSFGPIVASSGGEDMTASIISGKLRGLIDMRDKTIPNIQAQLDQLASQMQDAVNLVHNRGTSMPNVSSSYTGTRTFAKQTTLYPTATENTAKLIQGATSVPPATYGSLTMGYNATGQITMTSTLGGLTFAAGSQFSIAGSEDVNGDGKTGDNDGTYEVVSNPDNTNLVLRKMNPRQLISLPDANEDVALVTFDTNGDEKQRTTLRAIMGTDFQALGFGPAAGDERSTNDFMANATDPWSVNEVAAHMQGWLKQQGYSDAEVKLDDNGKFSINLNDSSTSLAFRDQKTGTAGGAITDVSINYDVDGDGKSEQTVQGFSNFFGLNDYFVQTREQSTMDSAVLPAEYATSQTRTLRVLDSTGQLGDDITVPKGASLDDIAALINKSGRVAESALMSENSFTLTSAMTITVSGPSGQLSTATVPAGPFPATLTLAEIAGALSNNGVTAQVVQEKDGYRLRMSAQGNELKVTTSGGAVSGSPTPLGEQLDVLATSRVNASVVPEGSGYRLRVQQYSGDPIYLAADPAGNGKSLLTDLQMGNAANGSANAITVRQDIQTAPEKVSRGSMQWNSDKGAYYLSEGDKTTALQLAEVMSAKVDMKTAGNIYAGNYSLTEYSSTTISLTAGSAAHSADQMDYQTTLSASLDFQMTSNSGVNLDEEVARMIDFQQAYSASAKVISTLRDMLQELVNIV